MSPSPAQTIADLSDFDRLDNESRAAAFDRTRAWRDAEPDEVAVLVEMLASRELPRSSLWTPLVDNLRRSVAQCLAAWDEATLVAASRLAEQLRTISAPAAAMLVELLGTLDGPPARAALVARLVADPPEPQALARIFGHLADEGAIDVFPALWQGLDMPRLAIAVLDLANDLTRRGLFDKHPGTDRVEQLAALLSPLADRLGRLAEAPGEFAPHPEQLRLIVDEAVALAVALCYALGLIGDPRAEAALRKAMELPHRRVQAEAAAALARVGQDDGYKRLAELAADPVARQRASHYLTELNRADLIPAVAEAHDSEAN